MATAMHESRELFTAPFLNFTERNRAIMEKAVRTTQEETLEFLNRSLERNVRTLERLRHCDGISELMAVDHEWFSEVMRDSFEQTQRMTKLWWRLTEDEIQAQADTARQGAKAPVHMGNGKPAQDHQKRSHAAA